MCVCVCIYMYIHTQNIYIDGMVKCKVWKVVGKRAPTWKLLPPPKTSVG